MSGDREPRSGPDGGASHDSDRPRTGDDARSSLAVALAVVLLTVAAVAPALVGARPANEIPVTELDDPDDAAEPTGDAWDRTPSKGVALASAPSGAPNADDTSIESASVRAIEADDRLFVRVSWENPSPQGEATAERNETPQVNAFGDAVAVQLPADVDDEPGIAMGSDRTPVNVWYWNAASGGEELLAGGPGTTSDVNGTVATNATYDDGQWHVVFERDLAADRTNRTAFDAGEDVRVAFAVWNGTNAERAGQKAVSDWQYFPLGPGPQGPPYETMLWTIAGLAIVVVLVATAMGVRRT